MNRLSLNPRKRQKSTSIEEKKKKLTQAGLFRDFQSPTKFDSSGNRYSRSSTSRNGVARGWNSSRIVFQEFQRISSTANLEKILNSFEKQYR